MTTLRKRTFHSAFAVLVLTAGLLPTLAPAPLVQAADQVTVVNTILTSQWSKPSPDPSGITYWPRHDHLVLVDGEVEEMAIWAGANVFQSTRAGSLVQTYDTSSWNNEPVGIDIDIAENGHWFISNDSKKTIFEIDLGADGAFGTGDDKRRAFLTSGFGNKDPEGLSLGGGKLYTVDGANSRVYITKDNGNGIFEGSDPTTWFDVGGLGVRDPEGIDYDPRTGNLWVVDRSRQRLNEITTSGTLLQSIDLEALVGAVNPGDVTLAPASGNTGAQHLYVVDRGVDNNVDPKENDGKIYELAISELVPVLPPLPGANLLLNSSFENDANNDGKPDVWSANTKFTRSAAVAHSGAYAGKFYATDNSGATIKQFVPIISAGTAYNIAAWVNAPTTSDAFTFNIKVQWRDALGVTIKTITIKALSDDTGGSWRQVTHTLTAPTGTASAYVMLNAASLNGTIYVDTFVFQGQ